MAPWKLPVVAAAIAIPIAAAFMLGGPGIGVAAGALVAVAVLAVAARQRPHGPIVPPGAGDLRRHVLLVVTCPVEAPVAVRTIVAEAGLGDSEDAEVLILAPARIGFLDRWASDLEPARQAAQRTLVATVAALAKAGVAAEARVGDEDVVQAIEDALQTFPATDVLLISAAAEEGGKNASLEDDAAAAELEPRLETGFRHVVVSSRER